MTRGSRAISGLLAQKNGSIFEARFNLACERSPVPMQITRIPDGCRQCGPTKIVRVKSPWDFVISNSGRTALLDTKSCDDSFRFAMVDENQITEMLKHVPATGGTRAGYVIQYRKQNLVTFLPAQTLVLALAPGKGSFSPTHPDAVILGTIQDMQPWKILLS